LTEDPNFAWVIPVRHRTSIETSAAAQEADVVGLQKPEGFEWLRRRAAFPGGPGHPKLRTASVDAEWAARTALGRPDGGK
jgi:hypothetical protein